MCFLVATHPTKIFPCHDIIPKFSIGLFTPSPECAVCSYFVTAILTQLPALPLPSKQKGSRTITYLLYKCSCLLHKQEKVGVAASMMNVLAGVVAFKGGFQLLMYVLYKVCVYISMCVLYHL